MGYLIKDAENILLEGRTDDNLKFSAVADYDITPYPLSFFPRKPGFRSS